MRWRERWRSRVKGNGSAQPIGNWVWFRGVGHRVSRVKAGCSGGAPSALACGASAVLADELCGEAQNLAGPSRLFHDVTGP